MYKFLPYMTNDYSVGLFDADINDIYHSAFGALTEAKEKFIDNINISDIENKKILDICYGIGYNSKVLINDLLKRNKKVNIDCVDTNKILIELSPFISSKISFIKRIMYRNKLYKNIFEYKEALKITKLKKHSSNYKINKAVNLLLLNNILNNLNDNKLLSEETEKILFNNDYRMFFDESTLNFYKFYAKNRVYLHQNKNKSAFVHNIYYHYISKRYKFLNKIAENSHININFYNTDIRKYLQCTNNVYDIVLLDGFTPQKCPCIWSVDLFQLLYDKMSDDSLIITYNKSAPVRKAMISSGFYIGNTVDSNNNISGTICSKNKNLIKNKLSAVQKQLLETKAGIPYRDSQLSFDNDTILINRLNEVKSSNLISSSKLLKGCKNEI